MAIISFSKTEDELLAGNKTVTRRDWADSHRRRFQRWYDQKIRHHEAWNRLPFLDGAQQIGTIHLTKRPYVEPLHEMDQQDLQEEGGIVDTVTEFCDLIDMDPTDEVTVIHFEFHRTNSSLPFYR